MKKLLTLFLLGITAAASAATVYDVYDMSYTNTYYEGTAGSYYTVKINQATKLYITDFFNNIKSGTQTELLTSPTYGLTKYGYVDADKVLHEFDFSDESRIEQFDHYDYNLYKLNQGLPADSFYRNGYYLGNFSAGDEIEIYLSDGTNSAASNSPTGQYISSFGRRTDALDSSLPIAQLYLGGPQINFGITAMSLDIPHGTIESSPVGSPLPPAHITLLLCMLLGAALYFKRRSLTQM